MVLYKSFRIANLSITSFKEAPYKYQITSIICYSTSVNILVIIKTRFIAE